MLSAHECTITLPTDLNMQLTGAVSAWCTSIQLKPQQVMGLAGGMTVHRDVQPACLVCPVHCMASGSGNDWFLSLTVRVSLP